MLEQFWQYGILIAVLIFGIKIGLALGFSGIKRKNVLLIFIGYGVGLTVLSYLLSPYSKILYNFVYNYTSYIFAVIAVIILLTGLKTIYDWKVTGKDVGSATCMAVVAPCPCCFGAILTSIIMASSMVSVSSVALGAVSSIALVIVMGVTYLLSSTIVKKINKPYPLFLGNFMIFIGLYFVLCLLILPNIESLTTGTPIEIQMSGTFIYMIIAMIILFIAGIIYAKKKSDFLQY